MAEVKELIAPASFSTEEELETLLLEGTNCGEPIEVTPKFWSDLHAKLSERRTASRNAS